MSIYLNKRLEKAASLVGYFPSSTEERLSLCGGGTVVADVGCDHAYLSIYLVASGKCSHAIASDLREGPLASARENIEAKGMTDRIETVLTNGLDGFEKYPLTDIVICGMGGDTMMDIRSRAPFIKRRGVRLILQPQTAFAELMLYLADAGFARIAERYAIDKGKSYRVIAVEYDGISRELSLCDALVGLPTFDEDRDAYRAFCQKILHTIDKKIAGATVRHADVTALSELKRDIVRISSQ